MPTYLLAAKETEDLLAKVIEEYHPRLLNEDVRVGILMAYASVDENTGEKKGHAIKGYAGAAAGASVKKVAAKDRLTKKYDVELLIDGDAWPNLPEQQKVAILDHEMTHIETTGKTDDNNRPLVKMREEDFIVWGFLEVVQRHGVHAMEHRSLKALIDHHGNLLLGLDGDFKDAAPPARRSGIESVTISAPGDLSVTFDADQLKKVGQIGEKLRVSENGGPEREMSPDELVGRIGECMSPTGQQINAHRRKKAATEAATKA